jgi:hypothetical protein
MLPDPLDVAFAAFGNDQAAALLTPELTQWGYAPDLAGMRLLVDAHPAEYWQANLYNLWLGSIRTLSPAADPGLPAVATTEAWGRRLLNTQLASWAELRHDTILYAKQPYTTGGNMCEYPDGYVDPYPAFYEKLAAYAARGQELVGRLDLGSSYSLQAIATYFDNLTQVTATLQQMAAYQRSGTPFTQAQLDFLNQTVRIQSMCGGAYAEGWYSRLFFDGAVDFDPTIADVHTSPTTWTATRWAACSTWARAIRD